MKFTKILIFNLIIYSQIPVRAQTFQDTLPRMSNLDGAIQYSYLNVNVLDTFNISTANTVGDGYYGWPGDSYISRTFLSFDILNIQTEINGYILTGASLQADLIYTSSNNNGGLFPQFFNKPVGLVPCVVDHINIGNELDIDDYTAGDLGDSQTLHYNLGIFINSPE